jgi:hypothetical protein
VKEFENVIHNIWESRERFYKAGVICALIIIAIYLADLVVVLIYGPIINKTIPELFDLFQQNRIITLLRAFSLDIAAAIIRIPFMAALFIALLKTCKSFILLLISALIGLIGICVYLSYNSVFSMLHLSDLYSQATDAVQKQQLITVGYTYMASFDASGIQAFFSFTLFGIWGILVSLVMYKSSDFGKSIAVIGIAGFVLEQGPPAGLYPSWWRDADPFLIGTGGVLLMIWYLFTALKLLKLSKITLGQFS